MKKVIIAVWLIIGVHVFLSFAKIDSQWRGPNRDGVYPNEKLLKMWPTAGPKLLWAADGLGQGFSSAAVTANRVYITGMIAGKGWLFAFDMNGKQVWKSSYGPEWDGSHPGARTTPTVVGNRIYLMSAEGRCFCFDSHGKIRWSVDLIRDFQARNLEWGITESLLVDGDRVFCTPGGPDVMLVALDRHSGKTTWKIKGNGEKSGYCSPRIVKHGKRRLLLTMTARSVVGVDADKGKYLWSYTNITPYDTHANTPLYHNGYIYIVSGNRAGGKMFKLSPDGEKINLVWTQKRLDCHIGGVILLNGYIYGFGNLYRGWYCLDWKTGEIQYTAAEVRTRGNIILSDGMFYCCLQNGFVLLVKPNPKKFEVVSWFRISRGFGPLWAHPVIKKARLYIRHGDSLMVYNIAR
jgi:outer membrane protein assembly factor BamB